MSQSERSSYSALDFLQWQTAGNLILSPKFQRRGVWTTPARSFLIDTLLLGMPVPPIYLRVTQSADKTKVIREVVDGQQRLSAVLDFVNDKYALSKSVDSQNVAGKRFSQLTEDAQTRINQYSFMCEVFYGLSDQKVLQIFARLNTHSVKLNAQELRNGKFFGPFKRTTYSLALEYLEFWRKNRIFTERNIARMAEAEMTSELLILQIDGPQDKKGTINDFYDKYDEEFPDQKRLSDRFRNTMDIIADSCGEILPESHFNRAAIFYSLYATVCHRLYSIAKIKTPTPAKGSMSQAERDELAAALRKLTSVIDAARQEEEFPHKYLPFVNACARQTDNIRPRITRIETIYREAFSS